MSTSCKTEYLVIQEKAKNVIGRKNRKQLISTEHGPYLFVNNLDPRYAILDWRGYSADTIGNKKNCTLQIHGNYTTATVHGAQ